MQKSSLLQIIVEIRCFISWTILMQRLQNDAQYINVVIKRLNYFLLILEATVVYKEADALEKLVSYIPIYVCYRLMNMLKSTVSVS